MKVFPDTNVLVSAFLSDGTCYRLLKLVLERSEHELIIGAVVLDEVRRKLWEKIRAPEPEIEAFVQALLAGARPHAILGHTPPVQVRDPDDTWVLASALGAAADVLVTGDKDLLEVADEVHGIRILPPRDLWDMLQSGAVVAHR
ncbi:MAG TPA: putative toxin-antitoxin system toxin component, PIN family [Longimicrobiaceae bacterium]|nr:putative toxin-antitoxin system toxin component, PIN family [Longimicrobiaceae bacterium]